uniref:Actin n=1 Tax=Lotharella oceanica TaxID=641309 RepID=A0A7S2XAY4_9EUKA
MSMLMNQPIVLDNGSGSIKAGFSATNKPKFTLTSYVGRPKYKKVMAKQERKEPYVGEEAQKLAGVLKLNYPIKNGVIQHWDDMETIWSHVYTQLAVQKDEHPVLITEAPLNPRKNRERMAEIFFETFNVPAFYVQIPPILSLYANGRTTGLVLDSGEGVTHAVPVFEGFALPHAMQRIDVAGRDVTEYLQKLLRKAGFNFHTTAEMEEVRKIKEKVCFTSYDYKKDSRDREEEPKEEHIYRLPDGRWIGIGQEKFRAPEVMFNPDLIGLEYPGVHECLVNSIKASDLDIRRTLYRNIVLAGGTTTNQGFPDRLLNSVRALSPRDTKIRIFAPQDRIESAWIGGAILGGLATFKKMWVERKEYRETGKSILYRRTF